MKLTIKESNNKYKTMKILQGYFNGWEDMHEADADDAEAVAELKDDLKAYEENDLKHSYRIITRKVPNPDYDSSSPRNSTAKGFGVYVYDDYNNTKELWYTDKNTTIDDLIDWDFVSYSPSFGYTLYEKGYDYLKKNFTLLKSPDDYVEKRYYSYITPYLTDGGRIKDVAITHLSKYRY